MIRQSYHSCTLTYNTNLYNISCVLFHNLARFRKKVNIHIMALIILNSVLYIVVLLATINA